MGTNEPTLFASEQLEDTIHKHIHRNGFDILVGLEGGDEVVPEPNVGTQASIDSSANDVQMFESSKHMDDGIDGLAVLNIASSRTKTTPTVKKEQQRGCIIKEYNLRNKSVATQTSGARSLPHNDNSYVITSNIDTEALKSMRVVAAKS